MGSVAGLAMAGGLASAAPTAQIRSGEVVVSVEIRPATAQIADLLTFIVEVESPSTHFVSAPDFTVDLEPFEVRSDFELVDDEIADGVATRRFEAKLAVFGVGPRPLPRGEILIGAPDGELVIELPGVGVTILSLLEGTDEQALREAKGVLTLPAWVPRWAPAGLLAVLLALLSLYLWSRRGVVVAAPQAPVEVPFDVAALRALRALEASSLIAEAQHKEYFVRLMAIVRRYAGARYRFDARELTSLEFLAELVERSAGERALALVRGIRNTADLAKFARYEPSPEESRRSLALAVELVEATRRVSTAGR